jgi:cytochrome c553
LQVSELTPLKTKIWALLAALPLTVNAGWEDAREEREEAMSLIPDVTRGAEIYETCAVCHMPEGWGTPNGAYPQIAGQHREVTIKQLADIRANNRDNPSMYPFALPEEIGGAQAIADVAAYIEGLKMTRETGKGPGGDLEKGKTLYQEQCSDCHGINGEGDAEKAYPLLQAQHYNYTLRQLLWIQNGKRRNANSDMAMLLQGMTKQELEAMADYLSHLQPSEENLSSQTWKDRR